jgi:hypothetical protein
MGAGAAALVHNVLHHSIAGLITAISTKPDDFCGLLSKSMATK